MRINTLGDVAKRIPKERFTEFDTPLKARTNLYGMMSAYIGSAMRFADSGTDFARDEYMKMTEVLLDNLLIDASAHLDDAKFKYLLSHSITEPGNGGYKFNGGDLMDAINRLWGSEDMFMFRLSGGLPASYVKAISGLKSQVRYTGFTLQQIVSNQKRSN